MSYCGEDRSYFYSRASVKHVFYEISYRGDWIMKTRIEYCTLNKEIVYLEYLKKGPITAAHLILPIQQH